jgi:hypothetical protein
VLEKKRVVLMDIALHLPDDVVASLHRAQQDVPRHVLESLALAWY